MHFSHRLRDSGQSGARAADDKSTNGSLSIGDGNFVRTKQEAATISDVSLVSRPAAAAPPEADVKRIKSANGGEAICWLWLTPKSDFNEFYTFLSIFSRSRSPPRVPIAIL